jgi:hypothetical protein
MTGTVGGKEEAQGGEQAQHDGCGEDAAEGQENCKGPRDD